MRKGNNAFYLTLYLLVYLFDFFFFLEFSNHIIKTVMLHNQLKSQFEDKEQQLFEIHLNSNHNTRALFQDVLRKNNDIIRSCLSKFNDIWNRFEQYQISAKAKDQQIQKMNEGNERFYFQFRKTHLSLQNKQNQLFNDVSIIKSQLRINNLDNQHKVHYQNENLKEKGHRTVLNTKQPKQNHFSRSKTNYGIEKSEISIDIIPDSNLQCNSNKKSPEKISKQQNGSVFNNLPLNFTKFDCRQNIKRQQLTKQIKQIYDNYYELSIKQTIQQKIKEISQTIQRKIAINISEKFDLIKQTQVQRLSDFLRKQIDEKSDTLVSKCFLEQSLVNLKNAWEKQEKHLIDLIETKVSTSIFHKIQKKVETIQEQIEKTNNILILKAEMRNLNLSSNFRQLPLNRAASKESLTDKLYIEAQPSCKRYLTNEESKVKHNFSNSLSQIRPKSGKLKQTFINVQNLTDFDNETQIITQKMWKQKAYNALGQSKILKKKKQQR